MSTSPSLWIRSISSRWCDDREFAATQPVSAAVSKHFNGPGSSRVITGSTLIFADGMLQRAHRNPVRVAVRNVQVRIEKGPRDEESPTSHLAGVNSSDSSGYICAKYGASNREYDSPISHNRCAGIRFTTSDGHFICARPRHCKALNVSLKTSKIYRDTPIVSTADRLPILADGTVLARIHGHSRWFRTRWSVVTRPQHIEWRSLEYTAEHLSRENERARNAAAKRKAEKGQGAR